MKSDQARTRNHLLDGLRGVAALAVVILHAGENVSRAWAASGYLAVDFFFVLSGFVIASAYGERLRSGLGIRAFLRQRLARLYPAFALALPLGIALTIVKWHAGLLPCRPAGLGTTIALNSVMLPSKLCDDLLFTINVPAWSLFFEVVVNLGYAAIGYRLKWPTLVALLAICAIFLIAAVLHEGTINRGTDWEGAVVGLVRALFGFSFGSLIARWRNGAKAVPSQFAILPLVVLGLLLFVPVGRQSWLFDLTFALIGAPLGVLICSGLELPPRLARLFGGLGTLSYPLYVIHSPVLRAINQAGKTLHLPPIPVVCVAMAAAVAAASVVARWLEPLGRRWLIAAGAR